MKDVFISYKAEEIDEAGWVKSVLEENGISCWMAPSCIPGGSSYAVEIPNAIRNAKVLVLILSSKCQSSQWVSREVDLALNQGKIVLPFMLENCALKDDFNFYLTNVQRYAAYENKAAAMEKMIREIKALVGGEESVERNTIIEKTAPQPTKKNYDVISICSLVFGIIAAVALYGALIVPNIVASILAVIGMKNISTKKVQGKGIAVAGMVLGTVTMLIGCYLIFGLFGGIAALFFDGIIFFFFQKYFKAAKQN